MSDIKEKLDIFDQAFNQIDSDSDSEAPAKSQETQQKVNNFNDEVETEQKIEGEKLGSNHDETTLTLEGGDSPSLDESIVELLELHNKQQVEVPLSDRIEPEQVRMSEEQKSESFSPETTEPCRRSQRIRRRPKNKTPPSPKLSRRGQKLSKAPPTRKTNPCGTTTQKPPPQQIQQDIIDISSGDDDEPMVVLSTTCTPRKTGNLSISSTPGKTSNDTSLQLGERSYEDYPYNLKLIRYGTLEEYDTTCHTKLCDTLRDLIDECKKVEKVLLLTRRNEYEPLPLDGTPHTLNLDSGTILNAISAFPHQLAQRKQDLLKQSGLDAAHDVGKKTKVVNDPNVITLKLQDGQRKHLREFQINLREPLGVLKKQYAEDFGHTLSDIRLCFDGDPCGDDETPESLELEDGYVLDVMVSH